MKIQYCREMELIWGWKWQALRSVFFCKISVIISLRYVLYFAQHSNARPPSGYFDLAFLYTFSNWLSHVSTSRTFLYISIHISSVSLLISIASTYVYKTKPPKHSHFFSYHITISSFIPHDCSCRTITLSPQILSYGLSHRQDRSTLSLSTSSYRTAQMCHSFIKVISLTKLS